MLTVTYVRVFFSRLTPRKPRLVKKGEGDPEPQFCPSKVLSTVMDCTVYTV